MCCICLRASANLGDISSLSQRPSNSALEFKRTTTSMSLADEKTILREVDKIKTTKLQLEEYNSYERMVQEKKVSSP